MRAAARPSRARITRWCVVANACMCRPERSAAPHELEQAGHVLAGGLATLRGTLIEVTVADARSAACCARGNSPIRSRTCASRGTQACPSRSTQTGATVRCIAYGRLFNPLWPLPFRVPSRHGAGPRSRIQRARRRCRLCRGHDRSCQPGGFKSLTAHKRFKPPVRSQLSCLPTTGAQLVAVGASALSARFRAPFAAADETCCATNAQVRGFMGAGGAEARPAGRARPGVAVAVTASTSCMP